MRFDYGTFIVLLAVNLLIVLGYCVWNLLFRKKERRRCWYLRAVVMLVCPVVGPCYFFFGRLAQRAFFRKPVDLVDVLFSKEREAILLKAEEEKERNLLPLEDSLIVSHKDDARTLFLDVIRREPKNSLRSISLALDSDDGEIAHYAASILQYEFDKIRKEVREKSERIFELDERLAEMEGGRDKEADPEDILRTENGHRFYEKRVAAAGAPGKGSSGDEEAKRQYYADISPELEASRDYNRHTALARVQGMLASRGKIEEEISLREELEREMASAHQLIGEMDNVLKQEVLPGYESRVYTDTVEKAALIVEKRDVLAPWEIASVAGNFLRIGEYEKSRAWCDKSFFYYPGALSSYSSRLKLLYKTEERDEFFRTLDELKRSDLTLDHDTLELVRLFG